MNFGKSSFLSSTLKPAEGAAKQQLIVVTLYCFPLYRFISRINLKLIESRIINDHRLQDLLFTHLLCKNRERYDIKNLPIVLCAHET
jgi:hypothetical protein